MPRRGWELRISDIIEAIESAVDYSVEMTFEQFEDQIFQRLLT